MRFACFALVGIVACTAVNFNILSWNVHWQCGSNFIKDCRDAATKTLVDHATTYNADVIVAVELEETSSTAIDLPSHGLDTDQEHWTQVNGSCVGAPGKTGDAIALALRSGHKVLASSGGCLGGHAGGVYKPDARAFVVALVKPAQAVAGCDAGLCIVGIHSPHVDITEGSDKVEKVCGDARHSCTIGIGDWNAPFSVQPFCNFTVHDRWEQLVGPEPASGLVAHPDENTCCYPESKYQGWDDHVVSNVPKAQFGESSIVLPYAMTKFSNDTEEHRAIFVELALPAA
jgi:hypothetical protein